MAPLDVLIVDDSVLTVRKLEGILMEMGHRVAGIADDGDDAIAAYRRVRPDLVTMDVTMPRVDGIAATRSILAEFPDARIIMVTSLGHEGVVAEALKAGASGYVLKPINPVKLAGMIDRVMECSALR